MKFIFTTDWHLKSMPASNIKIDNFIVQLRDRIQYLFSQNVDFILHGGDLFDTYNITDLNFFNDVLLLFKQNKIPFFVVPGQHDMIGYEPNSLKWSSLKTLENAGCITILQPGLNNIFGIPVYTIYPSKNHSLEMYRDIKKSVIVTHNIVSPVTLVYDYVLTSDISQVIDQCLVLCGDLHMSFEKIYDNCAFLNPGPFIQLTKTSIDPQGFFEISLDINDLACSYKKNLFKDIPVEIIDNSTIELFTDQLQQSAPIVHQSIEDLVSQVGLRLFNDSMIVKEALKWIESKKY